METKNGCHSAFIRLPPFACHDPLTRMPITCPITIRNLTQEEFDERDRIVMRCAYASQNALGRLCDERVYENDLALRLRAEGMKGVHTQVPVTVTHGSFEKVYRLDLIVEDSLYELKTVTGFVSSHDAQVLHYAMLANVNHGKLLNFRTAKVQGRLRFNAMTSPQRRQLTWHETEWRPLSSECRTLHERLGDLLKDWGSYLETSLYEDALIHFGGGEAKVIRRVPVVRDGFELGSHALDCHAAWLCFIVTSLTEPAAHRPHLQRLLALTGMEAIQWFNLNRGVVECVTVRGSMANEWGQTNPSQTL